MMVNIVSNIIHIMQSLWENNEIRTFIIGFGIFLLVMLIFKIYWLIQAKKQRKVEAEYEEKRCQVKLEREKLAAKIAFNMDEINYIGKTVKPKQQTSIKDDFFREYNL